MKKVRNNVEITTECCGFMNTGWFEFWLWPNYQKTEFLVGNCHNTSQESHATTTCVTLLHTLTKNPIINSQGSPIIWSVEQMKVWSLQDIFHHDKWESNHNQPGISLYDALLLTHPWEAYLFATAVSLRANTLLALIQMVHAKYS